MLQDALPTTRVGDSRQEAHRQPQGYFDKRKSADQAFVDAVSDPLPFTDIE